nr:putative sulfate exporter family transporter [Flavobacterium piscinae]
MIPRNKFFKFKSIRIFNTFLAFGINYSYMGKIGWQSFLMVAFVVFAVLVFSVYLSKKVNCPSTVGWMVGFGTAICGSSAIA